MAGGVIGVHASAAAHRAWNGLQPHVWGWIMLGSCAAILVAWTRWEHTRGMIEEGCIAFALFVLTFGLFLVGLLVVGQR